MITAKIHKINKRLKLKLIPRANIIYRSNSSVKGHEDDGYLRNESIFSNIIDKFRDRQPGTLVLVRHGQCVSNTDKKFTGWIDSDLSPTGEKEVQYAARLLLERGHTFDITYTSMMKRAIRSAWVIQKELDQIFRPVIKSWRLNERMYGALEGLSKPELAALVGEEQVQMWRAGLVDRPPPMTTAHTHWHHSERKYAQIDHRLLPTTESLQDVLDRTMPLWESDIFPDLKKGRNVMVVAHNNSLRGIIKIIDNLNIHQIQKINIPCGIPLVYKFDKNMNPITQTKAVSPLSGEYLEKRGLLRDALAREEEVARKIEGYKSELIGLHTNNNGILHTSASTSSATAATVKTLLDLEEQRKLLNKLIYKDDDDNKDYRTMNNKEINQYTSSSSSSSSPLLLPDINASIEQILEDKHRADLLNDFTPSPYNNNNDNSNNNNTSMTPPPKPVTTSSSYINNDTPNNTINRNHNVTSSFYHPSNNIHRNNNNNSSNNNSYENMEHYAHVGPVLSAEEYQSLNSPLLVIIRHGKTEHNKLGLFTGWEDAPLADDGRKEARAAGKLLQRHEIEFDVVYTSWLSRAIETAWTVQNELNDSLWLPVIKSWRLNERMYGALTGLSKKMIKQRHGQEQFMQWRRGYDTPPPPISSFSHYYPGNDERYVNYVQDINISLFETAIRSLAHGKFEIHRAFPKRESLKDCMERTIPYYKNVIVPNSLQQNKNVLISSSENAIRGLLMHLCAIPTSQIHQVEIPTGLPLIFDRRINRIRLLEDDNETASLFTKYNFGTSPDLLFKPDFMSLDDFKNVISDRHAGSKYGAPSDDPEDRQRFLSSYDPILRLKR